MLVLKTKRFHSLFLVGVLVLFGCKPESKNSESISEIHDLNLAAPGFDSINSDQKAIAWADAVMSAMGGRKKWDQTRFISWDFFRRRTLVWDKHAGNVRIEVPQDSIIYLTNINDETGKVRIKGKEVQDADSLQNLLKRAKSIWINDSYWLVMPFKLKDSGVTLKYLREDSTLSGEAAHVLGLTFSEVGDTPNNKYEVFITKSDSLVKQWAFFGMASQDSASAIWPWDNYKEYNGLLLSSDRSDDRGPHDVQVYDTLSEEAFTNFDWKMTE
ncbi:hypothetical protein [Fulvivirga sp.]|uniref:hypothetical protein n=1 Tax=Fulvivirga sp. TaxID=1931237 RepID=UPI0032EAF5C3